MENINPSQNVNRRGRFYSTMGLLVFMGGLVAVALGILFFYLPLLGNTLSSPGGVCLNILGIPAALIGGGLFVRGFTLQKDNPLAYKVGEYLKTTAIGNDSRYTFIRNISRRRLGYIDAVLIGPPGALVFRTINYKGSWINERVEWRNRARGGNLRRANTNPTKECARDVYHLREFFYKEGQDKVPVYGIIVFVIEPSLLDLKTDSPVIPVTTLDYLFYYMQQDYLLEERMKPPEIRAAVNVLIQ